MQRTTLAQNAVSSLQQPCNLKLRSKLASVIEENFLSIQAQKVRSRPRTS